MTTAADTISSTPSMRRQPTALCVAVGVAVTVGWVLYRHYWFDDVYLRILRWDWFDGHFWAVTLVIALALCVPYVLVLLAWGRGVGRSIAGAGVALGAGLVFWGIDHVFQDYVWNTSRDGLTAGRIYVWSELLAAALLVPLAWGLARRTGRRWLAGVLVGPLAAALLRELGLRWGWWHEQVVSGHHLHWQLQAMLYVAPFVLAILACWAIEARARPTS